MNTYTVTLNLAEYEIENEEVASSVDEALNKALASLSTQTDEKPSSFMVVGVFDVGV